MLPLHEFDLGSVEVNVCVCLLRLFRQLEPESEFQISYPNDVFKNGQKMCGILVQAERNLLVGVGFNQVNGDFSCQKLEKPVDNGAFGEQFFKMLRENRGNDLREEFFEQMLQKGRDITIGGTRYKAVGIAKPCIVLLQNQETGETHEHTDSLKGCW